MSSIPKSEKLATEVAKDAKKAPRSTPNLPVAKSLPDGPIKIKQVYPLNENVAILCFRTEQGTILLPEDEGFKEEGIVIGVGPGVPCGNGTRTPSQLCVGDVVTFPGEKFLTKIKPEIGVYKDQVVMLFNERSLLTKLPTVEFEIINA